jgi:putative Mg2+ transporter-C (MgtC) family protein
MPQEHPILQAVLRLGLALLLALQLGWEREQRSRSAGLRTYPLLSVCVCGFLLVGQRMGGDASEQADAFYGALNGIGFVGSGAILKSGDGVAGMGTAVTLWVAGAIGAGVAFAIPQLSAVLSLLSVLALWGPALLRRWWSAP